MAKLLTGKRSLKVFIGMDNDVFRLRKDWATFHMGVVDVQAMFNVWKSLDFQSLIQVCTPAIRKKLIAAGKNSTDEACRLYLQKCSNPGLQFFLEVFFSLDGVLKDKTNTLADWRHRPIHPTLIKYAALDSYYALKIFWKIYSRVISSFEL